MFKEEISKNVFLVLDYTNPQAKELKIILIVILIKSVKSIARE